MYAVPGRKKDILLDIKICIVEGSLIISENLKSYEDIPKLYGYNSQHFTV